MIILLTHLLFLASTIATIVSGVWCGLSLWEAIQNAYCTVFQLNSTSSMTFGQSVGMTGMWGVGTAIFPLIILKLCKPSVILVIKLVCQLAGIPRSAFVDELINVGADVASNVASNKGKALGSQIAAAGGKALADVEQGAAAGKPFDWKAALHDFLQTIPEESRDGAQLVVSLPGNITHEATAPTYKSNVQAAPAADSNPTAKAAGAVPVAQAAPGSVPGTTK